jgi:protein-tyrosine phosphatase
MIRRYPFKYVYNCRDLGAYVTLDGNTTKSQVFLRSDNLTDLQIQEITYLKSLGLQAVIDFRHLDEINPSPDPFANDTDVAYHNIAILDHAQFTLEDLNQIQLHDLYIQISKNRSFIQSVFKCLAQYEGVVLFHCSAGKDRTGVISALLLKLAGVSDVDIVADYEVSYTYLEPKYMDQDVNVSLVYKDLFDSKRDSMQVFLTYLNQNFTNIDDYFRLMDIEASVLKQIKKKFLQTGGFIQ